MWISQQEKEKERKTSILNPQQLHATRDQWQKEAGELRIIHAIRKVVQIQVLMQYSAILPMTIKWFMFKIDMTTEQWQIWRLFSSISKTSVQASSFKQSSWLCHLIKTTGKGKKNNISLYYHSIIKALALLMSFFCCERNIGIFAAQGFSDKVYERGRVREGTS